MPKNSYIYNGTWNDQAKEFTLWKCFLPNGATECPNILKYEFEQYVNGKFCRVRLCWAQCYKHDARSSQIFIPEFWMDSIFYKGIKTTKTRASIASEIPRHERVCTRICQCWLNAVANVSRTGVNSISVCWTSQANGT